MRKDREITHYYNWVVINNKFKDKPIFVETDNMETFVKKGFPAQIIYYIGNNLSQEDAQIIEQNIQKQNTQYSPKNFRDMLEEDEKTPQWSSLAKSTNKIFRMIEDNNTDFSSKVCCIVDLMKIYLATKPNSCSLDFNCKLHLPENYKDMLFTTKHHKYNYCFANKVEKIGDLENKICYIKDEMPDKKSLLRNILNELESIYTPEGKQYKLARSMKLEIDPLNRDTIYYNLKKLVIGRCYLIPIKVVEAVMKEASYEKVNEESFNNDIDITNMVEDKTSSFINSDQEKASVSMPTKEKVPEKNSPTLS
jgi:hypothetical protein